MKMAYVKDTFLKMKMIYKKNLLKIMVNVYNNGNKRRKRKR
jgi:hypothetical protein